MIVSTANRLAGPRLAAGRIAFIVTCAVRALAGGGAGRGERQQAGGEGRRGEREWVRLNAAQLWGRWRW
jgi:hypothetical protein